MALSPRKTRLRLPSVRRAKTNDVGANFAACSKLVEEACAKSAQIVFFPECFSFIGAAAGEAQAVAEPLSGPILARYRNLAKQHSVWLSLGGFQERVDGEERIYNTHVVIDGGGEIRATYRKIHLFDVPMVNLVESRQALAGSELVAVDSPAGRLGLTVCYDLRFPELFQKLTFVHGAQVLLVPSAFAVKTGEAHWETLLRARAIETQCYVVAAAQAGQHNTHGNCRKSWGHALAFDPWGKCVAKLDDPDGTGVAIFEIDADLIDATRSNMPMHLHRRYDLYGDGPHGAAPEGAAPQGDASMFFG